MDNTYDPDRHHRRSIRLPGWDYTHAAGYYVTIVTYGREELFGQLMDGRVLLTPAGRVVAALWRNLLERCPAPRTDEFVVMPNHVHAIVWIVHQLASDQVRAPAPRANDRPRLTAGSLGALVGNFKSVSARRINTMRHSPGAPVWQTNYYERIVRNERELQAIRAYIRNNPANWERDQERKW
jgi:REP element-mobilizing transposase RayT